MPSEKVNLLTTTSMTLLYYHRYQRYNKMFWHYPNEFIALQSVRDEYYKLRIVKAYSPPVIFWGYLKINARGSGHRAILFFSVCL